MNTQTALPKRTRERGYVTLFVLGIAASVFLALAGSMQTNRCLQEANRRQARLLQERAATIAVRP